MAKMAKKENPYFINTPRVTLVSGNDEKSFNCAANELLSTVLRLHQTPIDFPCAGKGTCLQCRVRVFGAVSPPSKQEGDALGEAALESGVRLACLVRILGTVRVQLPEQPQAEQVTVCGELPPFELKPTYEGYAAAVDIGTTTLAACICSSSAFLPLNTVVMKNPQTAYGSDVISRIELSLAGRGEELAASVVAAVNVLLGQLRREGDFSRITISGNTTMLYLLTRKNPECLSRAPFTLDSRFGETLSARVLGLSVPPETPVFLPHCISCFVGADITSALIVTRLCSHTKPSILADIGTNGELALYVPPRRAHGGAAPHTPRLFVCSTAAGPAFEGEGLAMGLRGASGAIDSIMLAGGSLVCRTIDSAPSRGICGSGIIDAVAVLRQIGVIDKTGTIQEEGHDFEHLITEYCGDTAVMLDEHVVVTQKDIRNIQLAKSAISAGMQTLLSEASLTADDIETVYLAGGFGSYVNLQNAARMGLLPAKLCTKVRLVGNASLGGAVLMTQNASYIDESLLYAHLAQTVDLASNHTFMDLYVQNMFF